MSGLKKPSKTYFRESEQNLRRAFGTEFFKAPTPKPAAKFRKLFFWGGIILSGCIILYYLRSEKAETGAFKEISPNISYSLSRGPTSISGWVDVQAYDENDKVISITRCHLTSAASVCKLNKAINKATLISIFGYERNGSKPQAEITKENCEILTKHSWYIRGNKYCVIPVTELPESLPIVLTKVALGE